MFVTVILLMGVVPFLVEATDTTFVQIIPASQTVSTGQTFILNVSCTPDQSIKLYEFKVSFNPTILHANSVTEGNIFNGYTTMFNPGLINNTVGTIVNVYGVIVGSGSVSNSGNCAYISFTAHLASGASAVDLYNVGVTDEIAYVPITVTNGDVTITETKEVVTIREFTLNVTLDGSGSVTKNPNQVTYEDAAIVQLTANPDPGWTFSSWTGDVSGSTNPTSITMNGNNVVTAHFVQVMTPQISNVTLTTSSPLDNNPLFGWVNISTIIIDNVAVSQVVLRIHEPDGSWNNVSMTSRSPGNYYYRSPTAFSAVGNYSYFIWVLDTSGNAYSSITSLFSMPANWDIDIDGDCTIFDLVLISNHYGERGPPGWIREDVDNNGKIQRSDLLSLAIQMNSNLGSIKDLL
jgi:hypothetical protein